MGADGEGGLGRAKKMDGGGGLRKPVMCDVFPENKEAGRFA